jgi:hypothetical protein
MLSLRVTCVHLMRVVLWVRLKGGALLCELLDKHSEQLAVMLQGLWYVFCSL